MFCHLLLHLPGSGVEDVEVGVTDGSAERLVREISGSSGQRSESPGKVAGRRVSPAARIAVESTFGLQLFREVGRGCSKKGINCKQSQNISFYSLSQSPL